jgi:hypothetical protein
MYVNFHLTGYEITTLKSMKVEVSENEIESVIYIRCHDIAVVII